MSCIVTSWKVCLNCINSQKISHVSLHKHKPRKDLMELQDQGQNSVPFRMFTEDCTSWILAPPDGHPFMYDHAFICKFRKVPLLVSMKCSASRMAQHIHYSISLKDYSSAEARNVLLNCLVHGCVYVCTYTNTRMNEWGTEKINERMRVNTEGGPEGKEEELGLLGSGPLPLEQPACWDSPGSLSGCFQG